MNQINRFWQILSRTNLNTTFIRQPWLWIFVVVLLYQINSIGLLAIGIVEIITDPFTHTSFQLWITTITLILNCGLVVLALFGLLQRRNLKNFTLLSLAGTLIFQAVTLVNGQSTSLFETIIGPIIAPLGTLVDLLVSWRLIDDCNEGTCAADTVALYAFFISFLIPLFGLFISKTAKKFSPKFLYVVLILFILLMCLNIYAFYNGAIQDYQQRI